MHVGGGDGVWVFKIINHDWFFLNEKQNVVRDKGCKNNKRKNCWVNEIEWAIYNR